MPCPGSKTFGKVCWSSYICKQYQIKNTLFILHKDQMVQYYKKINIQILNSWLGSEVFHFALYKFEHLKSHFWALSLQYMCHESECTESLLSKADRNHFVASRTPLFHKCPATVLSLFRSLFRDSDTTQRDYSKASYPVLVSSWVTWAVNFLF